MVVNLAELLQDATLYSGRQSDCDLDFETERHINISNDKLVVFDFDGTITTKDTFALFLKYYAGTPRWALNILLLLPVFLAYGLKLIDRNKVKDKVIDRFFRNQNESQIETRAESFARDVIPGLIRPKALETLNTRISGQKDGLYTLYICSASIGPYLRAYFKPLGIHNILATELETLNGTCTGQIDGWNVWGEGKMRRIAAEVAPNTVNIIEAYGDSRGDREMLDAAKASYWRPFRL